MQRTGDLGGLVAGVDEAGRGPLAGPVVAAAVILPDRSRPAALADSKKLSPAERERLEIEILDGALSWSLGWADPAEIDILNILEATMLAMRRALIGLSLRPGRVLVDGNRLPDLEFHSGCLPGEAIIGGDDKVPVISAASILAKTARDRMMVRLHELYPAYDFIAHKGYGTPGHRRCLVEHGHCDAHRLSFAPIKSAVPAPSRWPGAGPGQRPVTATAMDVSAIPLTAALK